MPTSFRKRLVGGETLRGTLITISHPEVAEIMALCGFDWLFIDMEHSSISLPDAEGMVRAAAPGAHSVIRCPSNDEAWIKRCLDVGADGIIIPRVNTRKEADYAVRHAKYPPTGDRSVGISRAHGYGQTFNEYISRANEDTALIIQCEHITAVDHLPEIVQTEGIDAVFVGPYDLSASMNKTGQVTDPEVTGAIDRIRHTCQQANMPLGIFGASASAVKPFEKQGFTLLAVGVDTALLASSGKNILEEIKKD
jgi:2-keto-3-deoxy-L-rhamnonate aldolase RhmA